MSGQAGLIDNTEYLETAERLSSFFPKRNPAALYEIYHDHAEIWHNYDQKSMTMPDVIERLEIFFGLFNDVSFKNIRRFFIEKGFVQQHDVVATHVNGQSLKLPACVIATVEAGKISRLEEYIDPAALAAVLSPT